MLRERLGENVADREIGERCAEREILGKNSAKREREGERCAEKLYVGKISLE